MDWAEKDGTGAQQAAREGDHNVGTGPSRSIPDGGTEGEAKQPKERTGKDSEMGGATGGTSGLPDASEGNDNTGGHS